MIYGSASVPLPPAKSQAISLFQTQLLAAYDVIGVIEKARIHITDTIKNKDNFFIA
jgi:hypothetical protein